jgi:glycosyltransferase involved in cell wall biosynthesis
MAEQTPTTPRASVVIPSYNHGSYIEAAIASVLSSTVDLELIVVDDGSTDQSPRLLSALHDPRLRLVLQENRGAHAALNRGVNLCRGDIVFILNSDDLFLPQRLPRVIETFDQQPNAALVCSWLEIIDGVNKSLGIKKAWHNMPPWPAPQHGPQHRPQYGPSLADTGEPLLAMLEQNFVSTTSNVAFRRCLWQQRGLTFAPLRYAHDWDFILSACRAPGEMVVLEEPLVRYRVHGHNTIAEGRDGGIGRMRFEILWAVARHAQRLCRVCGAEDLTDLKANLWRSLPPFGQEELLAQLLAQQLFLVERWKRAPKPGFEVREIFRPADAA